MDLSQLIGHPVTVLAGSVCLTVYRRSGFSPTVSTCQSGGWSSAHLVEIMGGTVGVAVFGFGEEPDKTSSSETASIVDSK